MLVSAELAQVPTVNRLVKLWSDRYLPDLSSLTIDGDSLITTELREATSLSGRIRTATKLRDQTIDRNCKLAALRTKDLYTRLPETLYLEEARQLAQSCACIYFKLFDVYQEFHPVSTSSTEQLRAAFGDSSLSAWGIPKIDKLASMLEPLLLDFQEKHIISKDWRTLGFITTQINFSNALLLKDVTPVEQVLISPYLNFVEEQVALPWQRICAAASRYDLHSPAFVLVEKMLPIASDISASVYDRLLKFFPDHYSRRGKLSSPEVRHSCLRDLDMFQAYLWLCVLKESMTVVEQELVALCIMVMESVGVKWEMTAHWNAFLMEEVLNRVEIRHKQLVEPYAKGMVEAFHSQKARFGAAS